MGEVMKGLTYLFDVVSKYLNISFKPFSHHTNNGPDINKSVLIYLSCGNIGISRIQFQTIFLRYWGV